MHISGIGPMLKSTPPACNYIVSAISCNFVVLFHSKA